MRSLPLVCLLLVASACSTWGPRWYSRCPTGTSRSAASGLCQKRPCWGRCSDTEECVGRDRCVPRFPVPLAPAR